MEARCAGLKARCVRSSSQGGYVQEQPGTSSDSIADNEGMDMDLDHAGKVAEDCSLPRFTVGDMDGGGAQQIASVGAGVCSL